MIGTVLNNLYLKAQEINCLFVCFSLSSSSDTRKSISSYRVMSQGMDVGMTVSSG